MRIIYDTCTSSGLRTNMNKGKTEEVLELRGQRARLLRRELALAGGIHFTSQHHWDIVLHHVPVYKHMGSATRP